MLQKTVSLDNLESSENSSGIKLATYSIQSEILDCKKITDKENISIVKNKSNPILIKGKGKIKEFISTIEIETRKSGEQEVIFEKDSFFEGQGVVFDLSSNKCFESVTELIDLKKITVAEHYNIQAPEANKKNKSIDCS